MEANILKKKIMRRVYTTYALRLIINRFSLKCTALVFFMVGVVSVVSVTDVLANMPYLLDTAALFYFSKYAFMNAELTVQAFLLGTIVFMMWLAKDLVFLSFSLKPQRIV
ncbi:hypothetical protein IIC45_01290 [Patescibacteria group bacterium]|nr:hypothetical protein [Patescibacteria group bacterium]